MSSAALTDLLDLPDVELVERAERGISRGQIGQKHYSLIYDAGIRHRAGHILTPAQRDNLARVLAGEPTKHQVLGVHPELQPPTAGESQL